MIGIVKTPNQLKKIYSSQIGEALWPLVEDVLSNAYNKGWVDACDVYQKLIDRLGLREAWIKASKKCSNCGRSGPIPKRFNPHMGQCGTCGRIPDA